jgi:peptide-methionine (R)-S-oxide reductase
MKNRRQFIVTLAGAGVALPAVLWLTRTTDTSAMSEEQFPLHKSDSEWRAALTPDQYRVLRGHSTERAFTSALNAEKRSGTFLCAGCGHPLFSSRTKFESGTGWPSFWKPLDAAVGTSIDRSFLMVRTEVHCARCGGHLGHVFDDGPEPTGLRYCINGLALKFVTGSGAAS